MGIEFLSAVVLQGPPGGIKTFAIERRIGFLDLRLSVIVIKLITSA